MKKIFDTLIYISFFAGVVAFVILIIAHFTHSTPLGTSARGVAGFTVLCLVWVIILNLIEKRLVKGGE